MVLSVLIVEDDRAASALLSRMIAMTFSHIAITVVYDGIAGLEMCQEHPPDILLTDIDLPGLDGIRMAEHILALKRETKVIVVTGYSDKLHQERFAGLGIRNYFLKPLDLEKIFAAIEEAIEEIRRERQPATA